MKVGYYESKKKIQTPNWIKTALLNGAAMHLQHHVRPDPHLQLLRPTTLNPIRMCLLLVPHIGSHFQLILITLEPCT